MLFLVPMNAQRTVMIVEDEPDAAEVFAEMTRVSGFRMLKHFSNRPAMPAIAAERQDVILHDVMMAEISGLEVLRPIHRESELAGIPVIVVLAKSMPSDIKIGLEAGASLYHSKPVGFLDLKEAVDQVLQGHDTPQA